MSDNSNSAGKNKKPAVNNTESGYISDPELVSKAINHFILSDSGEQKSAAAARKTVNKNQYNRENIIDALTNMQITFKPKYVEGTSVNVNTNEFKSALLTSMAKLQNSSIPKTMNQLDSRTIDFVEMIFGAFLRDKNISSSIKELLLLMQVPIIKLSLIDDRFFNNENHPARGVLNAISHIGIGIDDRESAVCKTIQYIIEQVLSSFDKKIDVFNVAKMSLDRLADIEKSKNIKNEKETKRLIKIEYTKQFVLKELQFYTSGVKIPDKLLPLILSHWPTLMFGRLKSFGSDSLEWREVVGILRLLTTSFKEIETREDWIALRSIYKGVVNSVNSGLNSSLQNKEKVFVATSNLNNYYFSKLTDSEFYSEKQVKDEPSKSDYSIDECLNEIYIDELQLSPFEKQIEASKITIDTMPDFISQDQWFEVFTDYMHPVRRLKLSVIIKEQARLVFVDYMGKKVLDKDLDVFCKELQNDQSRLINDHSIFEYALNMVIMSIDK